MKDKVRIMPFINRLLSIGLIFTFVYCNDIDRIYDRLDDMQEEIDDLKTATQALRDAYENGKIITDVQKTTEGSGGWAISFSDNTTISLVNGKDGEDGDAFFSNVIREENIVTFILIDGTEFKFAMLEEPKLLTFNFRAAQNALQIVDDAVCSIEDNVVACRISNLMIDKNLTPEFTFCGDSIYICDKKAVSGENIYDFRQIQSAIVYSGNKSRKYSIIVNSYTQLPILWINAESDITSKEDYVGANIELYEDIAELTDGTPLICDANVKGRGNSTWDMPKKPYALKFNEKQSVLGMPQDKSWVLLANYTDKTMLRNFIALYMGQISNLEYTPRFQFCELMLNGRYNGTYLLGEKLKISKSRVNVGDDGFLLEVDGKADDDEITFSMKHANPINIKDPEVEVDDDNYNYIKDFVTNAETALYSTDFTDPENGWQKYMDMESFVDWYLINEITKNNDALMHTSCYMNLKRGEKLKMGPLWDFDISLGNINYNGNQTVDGIWVASSRWFKQLMKDPAFVARVKERFEFFYSHKDYVINEINTQAQILKYAVEENENKWGTFYTYTWPNNDIWGCYQNEVQCLKIWYLNRLEWLKTTFDAM